MTSLGVSHEFFACQTFCLFYVWYNFSICSTWVFHMSGVFFWCVQRDSFIRVTWLIHMYGINLSYLCFACHTFWLPHVWYDFSICVTWVFHMSDMFFWYVQRDSFILVTWLMHICGMNLSYLFFASAAWYFIASYLWRNSMCDMTSAYECRDAFICGVKLLDMLPLASSRSRAICWLQHTATHILTATHWLQHTARYALDATHCNAHFDCNTLQCNSIGGLWLRQEAAQYIDCNTLQHTHWLQHNATHTLTATHCNTHIDCNTLTATLQHCNAHWLQHTATRTWTAIHCNTTALSDVGFVKGLGSHATYCLQHTATHTMTATYTLTATHCNTHMDCNTRQHNSTVRFRLRQKAAQPQGRQHTHAKRQRQKPVDSVKKGGKKTRLPQVDCLPQVKDIVFVGYM